MTIDPTSSVYLLAERIARAETKRGVDEGRIRNAVSFERKVRDNLLERVQQRGTGWLVEQALRWDCDVPDDLADHKPSKHEQHLKRPALCPTCGVTVPYDPKRPVRLIDNWPWTVTSCARGFAVPNCHEFHARGADPALQSIDAEQTRIAA